MEYTLTPADENILELQRCRERPRTVRIAYCRRAEEPRPVG